MQDGKRCGECVGKCIGFGFRDGVCVRAAERAGRRDLVLECDMPDLVRERKQPRADALSFIETDSMAV